MDVKDISTLNDSLKVWAREFPNEEAFTFFDRGGRRAVCRPRELFQMAGRFASGLRKHGGFQPGDVVCNAVPNSVERLVTDFGVILAGCVPVNCQVVEKGGDDFWNMAQLSGCVAAILPIREDNPPYRLLKQFLPEVIPGSGYAVVSIPKAPKLKTIILVDRYGPGDASTKAVPSLVSSLKESSAEVLVHKSKTCDLAYIFQTSGSTGYSKLIPRTHEELMLTARALATPSDVTNERNFNDRPFGWTGGFPLHFFRACAPTIAQDCFDGQQAQTVRQLWTGISREKCAKAFLLPSIVLRLVEEFSDNPPDYQLNLLITGGQPTTKAITAALGMLAKHLIISYASTEASVITNLFIADKSQYRDFLCGRPFPDTSIRVVDDRLQEVRRGTEGRILLKSPRQLRGYYNHVPEVPIFTPDGWFITGDSGWVDEEGAVFVCDREDSVIHHGAILVYPSWPEEILSRCACVQEVVVVGVPNSTGGKDLCACVVLKKEADITKDGLMKFYQDSFISWDRQEYIPILSFIEFVDEIPKTFNSKVDLRRLKRLIFNRLGVNISH